MELAQKLVKQIWWSSDTFSGRDGRAEFFFGRSGKEGQVLIRLSPLLRPIAIICMLPQDVHAVMLFIHISLVDTHLHPLRHDAADFWCYLGSGIFGDRKVASSCSPPFRSNPRQQISETELRVQTKLVKDFGVAAFERNRSFWKINFHSLLCRVSIHVYLCIY